MGRKMILTGDAMLSCISRSQSVTLALVVRQVLLTEAEAPSAVSRTEKSPSTPTQVAARYGSMTDAQEKASAERAAAAQSASKAPARQKRRARIGDKDRIYWSAVASTIGTYNATNAFPGEENSKSGSPNLYEGYPHRMPGAIHIGDEIGKGGSSVWWGQKGSYRQIASDWRTWKQQTRGIMSDLGITSREKARLLTAISVVTPIVGAVATAAANMLGGPIAASIAGAALTTATTEAMSAAAEARSKVAELTRSTRGSAASNIAQATGAEIGAQLAAELEK